MKPRILFLLMATLIFVASITGCGKRNTFVPPPLPEVTIQHPIQKTITIHHPFPGRMEAYKTVEIRARVSGFLRDVEFKDGQSVEKGKRLFKIEPDQYQASVKTAEAQLIQAKASKQLAETTYKRKKLAFETEAVSELDLLSAEAELNSAEAAVQVAEADLTQAKLNLSYTDVATPIAGRVSEHLVNIGNLVGGSEATLLTTLIVEDPIYIYFNVDERSLLFLQHLIVEEKESPPDVLIELADGTQYDKKGVLDYGSPTMDPDTGTIVVRAIVDNPDTMLLPGMFSRVLIPYEIENAILVPDLAIQHDMVGSYVLIVDKDDTVQSKYLTTGPGYDDMRVIKEGLETTDRVVIKGIQKARPGIKVKVTGEESVQADSAKENSEEKETKEDKE